MIRATTPTHIFTFPEVLQVSELDKAFTSAQDSAYMYIYYALGDGNKAQALSTMQVEVGSVPTSYEPYPRVLRVYHGTDLVYGSSTDSQGSGQNSGGDTIIAGGEV